MSVLLFGGLALIVGPATAQGGGDADDNETCTGNTICEEITVMGESWNADSHRGGNMWGWGAVVPTTPPAPAPPPPVFPPGNNWSISRGGQDLSEEQLSSLIDGFCKAVRNGDDPATFLGGILAIVRKNPWLFVLAKGIIESGEAACNMFGG